MTRYPVGARFAQGRYVIDARLRGSDWDGLYVGRRLGDPPRDVLISFRRWTGDQEYLDLLRYEAPGIAPVWIGSPDGRTPIVQRGAPPQTHLVVIELRPRGILLEAALLADPDERITVEDLRDGLLGLARSMNIDHRALSVLRRDPAVQASVTTPARSPTSTSAWSRSGGST